MNDLKEKIKSIPFLGKVLRAIYNLLRINHIKYIIFENKKNIDFQQEKLYQQEQTIKQQEQTIKQQQEQIENIEDSLNNLTKSLEKATKILVREQTINQYKLLHQKVEKLCKKQKENS
jgi:septal ring factor EnvC (AmiA/AmiB activator)